MFLKKIKHIGIYKEILPQSLEHNKTSINDWYYCCSLWRNLLSYAKVLEVTTKIQVKVKEKTES